MCLLSRTSVRIASIINIVNIAIVFFSFNEMIKLGHRKV